MTDFGCKAKVIGSGDPKTHSLGLGCVLIIIKGFINLLRYKQLWMLHRLKKLVRRIIEVITCITTQTIIATNRLKSF